MCGSIDALARITAEKLKVKWNQPVRSAVELPLDRLRTSE